MLIHHFFFKIDFLNFFANIHVICQIFLSLLFEEIFISWVNFAEILKLLKNLFTFVKSHVILCAEIVKYSFGHKIYLHCLVCLYFLLDFIHNSLIEWTEENFSVVLFVLKWVEVWLWYFFSIDSFEFDAVLENLREVHFVFGEKGATLPFCEENFVETFLRLSWYIKIISFGVVLSLFKVKQSDAQLQYIKVESGLLDSLVKFSIVGIESLDMCCLGD